MRVKDPARDPLPADVALAEQIRRGYAPLPGHAAACPRQRRQRPLVRELPPPRGAEGGRAPAGRHRRRLSRVQPTLRSRLLARGPGGGLLSAQPQLHRSPEGPQRRARERLAPPRTATRPRCRRSPPTCAGSRTASPPRTPGPGATHQRARLKRIPLSRLDPARGARLYRQKCELCHGRDGQGVDIGDIHPGPLWGPRSWNDGAGAARVYTLASFVRHAMPYSAPGSLTDEEAQQIAAYIDSKPRPGLPGEGPRLPGRAGPRGRGLLPASATMIGRLDDHDDRPSGRGARSAAT